MILSKLQLIYDIIMHIEQYTLLLQAWDWLIKTIYTNGNPNSTWSERSEQFANKQDQQRSLSDRSFFGIRRKSHVADVNQ